MNNFTHRYFHWAAQEKMKVIPNRFAGLLMAFILACAFSVANAQLLRSATGPAAGAVTAARDQFRADLGGGTIGGANGSFGGLRREINWDGVPDAFAAPNNLPANFFNANSPRGAVFSTPGVGFQVSANAGEAPVYFGNIDPSYPVTFQDFSPQRLFTPLNSNVTDVNFFLPGTSTPALTRGFGAIFSDVDMPNSTSIEYFDANGLSLGVFFVPAIIGQKTFSFLGVSYPTPMISRVRIIAGNTALGAGIIDNPPATDLVVMDDFLYGEPTGMVWYRDFDGDGFGDPARSVSSPTQPAGYVSNNQDCNDYRVYYQDNDNDGWGNSTKLPCGTITRTGDCDDNNNKVHSLQTFYRDQDGDSWGNPAMTTVVCSSVPPPGYVANCMDCNDNDKTIRYCPTTTTVNNGKTVQELQTAATLTLAATPNPFAKATRIQYTVPEESHVRIQVFDITGREVGLLVNGKRSAGMHYAEYNTTKLASGVYYLRLAATANGKQQVQTQKLMKAD